MAKSRDEVLELTGRRYTEVQGIRLQSLTEYELSTLESRWAKSYRDTEDIDPAMRSELLTVCMVDDDGERLFTSAEVEKVQMLDSSVSKKLYVAARKHCGMDNDDVAVAEKKSEETEG